MHEAPNLPLQTPWGVAQQVTELAPGIELIATAGHGGYRLSRERRDQVLARMGFDLEWYEEDDAGQVVRGIFAAELGIEDGDALLADIPQVVLELLQFEFEETRKR